MLTRLDHNTKFKTKFSGLTILEVRLPWSHDIRQLVCRNRAHMNGEEESVLSPISLHPDFLSEAKQSHPITSETLSRLVR